MAMTVEYRVVTTAHDGAKLADMVTSEETFRAVYADHLGGDPQGPARVTVRAWRREVTEWEEVTQ